MKAQQVNWLGDVILAQPLSFKFMACFACLVILSICIFGYFGTYTKKSTLTGEIVPAAGIVRIFPPQAGVVLESKVKEGQHINAGAVLFVMSSDKASSLGDAQAVISMSIRQRQSLLAAEMARVRSVSSNDRATLITKIASSRKGLAAIDTMIKI